MPSRITECKVVDSLVTREYSDIEESILDQIGNSPTLNIEDGAIPYVAVVVNPQGRLDRMLKNFLRGMKLPGIRWETIALMARVGSRTKAYAEKRASEESS